MACLFFTAEVDADEGETVDPKKMGRKEEEKAGREYKQGGKPPSDVLRKVAEDGFFFFGYLLI